MVHIVLNKVDVVLPINLEKYELQLITSDLTSQGLCNLCIAVRHNFGVMNRLVRLFEH